MSGSTRRPPACGLRPSAVLATGLPALALAIAIAIGSTAPAHASGLRAQDAAAQEVCAVLYLSGDFVVQPGPDPDPAMGRVITVFRDLGDTGFSQASPPPWRDYGTWLERVSFRGGAAPSSLDHWFDNEAGAEGEGDLADYPFTEVDLSGLDASRLRSMWCTFNESHLKKVDLSGMTFPVLEDMGYAFYGSDLVTVSAEGLNTPRLSHTGGMFERCMSLKTVSMRSWRAPVLSNMRLMFNECPRLRRADFAGLRAPSIELCSHMFANCWSLEKVRGIRDLRMRKLRSFSYMYKKCYKLKRVDLSRWAPASLARATAPFGHCDGLRHVIVGAGFRKLPRGMFAGTEEGLIVTLRTKKLAKKSVRYCMAYCEEWVNLVGGGKDVEDQYDETYRTKVRVQLGSRAANVRWAKKYREIFTLKNAGGQKTRVVAARAPAAA